MCEIHFLEWGCGDEPRTFTLTLDRACDLHLCPVIIHEPPRWSWYWPSASLPDDLPAPPAVLDLDRDPRGQIADLIDHFPADVYEGSRGIARSLRRWPKTEKKLSSQTRARRFAAKLLLLELKKLTG